MSFGRPYGSMWQSHVDDDVVCYCWGSAVQIGAAFRQAVLKSCFALALLTRHVFASPRRR